MKRVKLTTNYDCCFKLSNSLKHYRATHKTTTTSRTFINCMKDQRACNNQEASRLFAYLVNEKIIVPNENKRYTWDCKEDLIAVDWVRKIIEESDIASTFGNKGHKRVSSAVKVEKSRELKLAKEVISKEDNINKMSTDDIVKILNSRGYNVILISKDK